MAANLAGGTHHAHAAHGEGFCVFNDAAVATRVLQREGAVERVAVVDLDVHQGNGTAALFATDPSVFTFSVHGAKNYPFRRERSSLDVELPDGADDGVFLSALDLYLPSVLRDFAPDLVLYLAGADPFLDDRFGRLCAHPGGAGRARPAGAGGVPGAGDPRRPLDGGRLRAGYRGHRGHPRAHPPHRRRPLRRGGLRREGEPGHRHLGAVLRAESHPVAGAELPPHVGERDRLPARGECAELVTRPTGFPVSGWKSGARGAGAGASPRRRPRRWRFTCPRCAIRTITSCPV